MSPIVSWLTRPRTSSMFDANVGRLACWLVSCAVLILGTLKLWRLPLNETELFFGLLLILAVVLLGILIGLVLPLAARATASEVGERSD